jgi:phenylacetate-CoA ligase
MIHSDPSFLPPEEFTHFQTAQLEKALRYVGEHSPYYRRLFSEVGYDVNESFSLARFSQLPTVSKTDLFQHNREFLCVPNTEIREWVTTSGTIGDPVLIALTENDLIRLGRNEAYSYRLAELQPHDLIQLTTTLDKRFMAGMAYYLGAREYKTAVVRTGPGIPELQWDTIRRLGTTVLVAVPSFLLRMIEYAEAEGIDLSTSTVKKVICIGEPLRNPDLSPNALANRISEKWPLQLFSTYASTEMATAFTECEHGKGGHMNPELIWTECLDEQGIEVPEGEPGEITITQFGVEGMPLVRFRTGDMARVYKTPCPCGRYSLRVGPVEGRRQQMIKYRGTSLYPPAIFDLLNSLPQIETYVVELRQNDLGTDEIVIRAALNIHVEDFAKILKDKFRAKLRVAPQIIFEDAQTINRLRWPESNRKPSLLLDLR